MSYSWLYAGISDGASPFKAHRPPVNNLRRIFRWNSIDYGLWDLLSYYKLFFHVFYSQEVSLSGWDTFL